jgi:hypothetical protein
MDTWKPGFPKWIPGSRVFQDGSLELENGSLEMVFPLDISVQKIMIGTPELDFGTLEVQFRGWISGSPVFQGGFLEVRFSGMDTWSQKLDIWRWFPRLLSFRSIALPWYRFTNLALSVGRNALHS